MRCKAILLLNTVIIDFYGTFCSNNVESEPFIHVCQSVVTVVTEFREFVRKYLTTSLRTNLWLQVVILIVLYSFSVYVFPVWFSFFNIAS